jgi:hypothetical protein
VMSRDSSRSTIDIAVGIGGTFLTGGGQQK